MKESHCDLSSLKQHLGHHLGRRSVHVLLHQLEAPVGELLQPGILAHHQLPVQVYAHGLILLQEPLDLIVCLCVLVLNNQFTPSMANLCILLLEMVSLLETMQCLGAQGLLL